MRTIKTNHSDKVFVLEGGTEENDLHVELGMTEYGPTMTSTWMPDADDLATLNAGGGIELVIWGSGHPPVSLAVAEKAWVERP
jgi:hypothetical protein